MTSEEDRADPARCAELEDEPSFRAMRIETVGLSVKERLARDVFHDINNALMGVVGCAKLALSKLDPSAPARPYILEIESATAKSADLARRFLSFGRRYRDESCLLAPNEVVERIEPLLRRGAGPRIDLSLRLGADLPLIEGDRSLLEQALMSLVLHCREMMPEGGGLVISSERTPGASEPMGQGVLPSDAGIAVRIEARPKDASPERMFEALLAPSSRHEGSGRDLAVVREIVERFGGSSEVERDASAARAELWFRAVPDGPLEGQAKARAMSASPEFGGSARARTERERDMTEAEHVAESRETGASSSTVLLVEDEALARKAIRALLESAGFTVLEAESAKEALSIARDRASSLPLLLSDLDLPDMSGQDLFRELKALRPEMTVIFMSGHASDDVIEAGWIQRDQAFVSKPIDFEDLVLRLRRCLGGR